MIERRRKTKKSDRKYWIDQCDKVFSLYIRLRDSKEFKFQKFRCISCGDEKPFDQMDCGHFVSRNCMLLRWHPSNAWGECAACNRFHSDHILGYRRNLIIKLGEDALKGSVVAASLDPQKRLALVQKMGEKRVQELEALKYTTKKWSIEELKEKYMYYAALVLELKKEM